MNWKLFTDGSCYSEPYRKGTDPLPGGWAYILKQNVQGAFKEERSGAELTRSNNSIELAAVVRGLEAARCLVSTKINVLLHCDSQYVFDRLLYVMECPKKQEHFRVTSLIPEDWKKPRRVPTCGDADAELCEALGSILKETEVRFAKVKKICAPPEHRLCDYLAAKEMFRLAKREGYPLRREIEA